MNPKGVFYWFYDHICYYNLFMVEENEYDDEPQDPPITLKHQKYSTWLYVLLLIGNYTKSFFIFLIYRYISSQS